MSEYYQSSDYGRYKNSPDYQLATQRARAKRAGQGYAVNAIMQDEDVEGAFIDREMNKILKLKELGMQKKRMDHSISLGERRLALSERMQRDDLLMQKKRFKERKRQARESERLGMISMPLSLGVGILNWQADRDRARRLKNLETDLRLAFGAGG